MKRCSCVEGTSEFRRRVGRPCHVHGDVDEILWAGEWLDRRGWWWILCDPAGGCEGWWGHESFWCPSPRSAPLHVSADEMRARIVRDQHREKCEGLWLCRDHPVPSVLIRTSHSRFAVILPPRDGATVMLVDDLGSALDAARQTTRSDA